MMKEMDSIPEKEQLDFHREFEILQVTKIYIPIQLVYCIILNEMVVFFCIEPMSFKHC